MIEGGLSYGRYRVEDYEEWVLQIGPSEGPGLLVLPPFFEEMNRTRALLVGTMRCLAAKGWTCLLPDLPGTGESPRPLETCRWQAWRAAIQAAAPGRLAGTVALRGGCLLDDAVQAPAAWRLSPVDGAALVRDLDRAARAGDGGGGGYSPASDLAGAIAEAVPADNGIARTLRLTSDPGAADRKLDFPPLWRRAEPQAAPELSTLIAADIDQWMRACAAS